MLVTFSAKLTGTPDSSSWSQVHEFKPEDPEKLAARGILFAVFSTRRTEGSEVDTIASGRELIARLHEEYFGNLEAKPFNALKNAVEKVANEFRESWGETEIVAASFVEGVLYSAAGGGGEVTLSRQGALATILKSGKDGIVSASGYPNKGDVILLATKNLFNEISLGVIKAALGSSTPEEAIEVFAPQVHGKDGLGSLAAIVIKFDEKSVITEITQAPPEIKSEILESYKKGISVVAKLFKKIPEKNIYVKSPFEEEATSESKKLSFSVAIILLLVLVVSIGFGIRQKKINDVKKKYQSILVAAQKDVDDAISLASVNQDKSRELFLDSEQKLAEIEALKVSDSKVSELKKKIEESRGAILGEYEVSPELFLDLGLLSSGYKGDELTFSGGNIFILDKSGKRIISVVFSNKKSKIVAGPTQIDEAQALASYENRAFVLASDGVYEVGSTKTKSIDKTWSGDALIKAFAGNLYVLDKSGNAIYRYAGSGSDFGSQQNWLASGARVNFSDATSWGIDGAVYVLFPNSKILKFSLGSPQNFKVSGVLPEIGKIDAISASEDNKNLYLLDRAGKRIVAIDKNGKYVAQYIGEGIQNATNLVVSEADKKAILLSGDKLLSFSFDVQSK